MSTVILRWTNGSQESSNFSVVGSSPPGEDIFVVFKTYLQSNKISYTDVLPDKEGLWCIKNNERFDVINTSPVPNWEIPDIPAPLYNTYFFSLQFLGVESGVLLL